MAYSQRNNQKGQVGIGTMIVFLAMILVAAFAASVIIGVGQQTQEQAQQTGEETLSEVSDQVMISGTFGTVSSSSTVDEVLLKLRLSSGGEQVDLGEATVQVLSNETQSTLLHDGSVGSEGTVPSSTGNFTVNTIKDDDNSLPVLEERSDRAEIAFQLASDQQLQEGDEATVRVITQTGAEHVAVLDAPFNLNLDDGDTIEL